MSTEERSDSVPSEQFSDSHYSERLGFQMYDEALTYRGAAQEVRVEFAVPKVIPVSWGLVKKTVEARLALEGHKALTVGLYKGPIIKKTFGRDAYSYKLEIIEHGSPAWSLIAIAIIRGLAILFGAVAFFLLAVRATPTTFENITKAGSQIMDTLKYVAVASIAFFGYSIFRTVKGR